jgi:3-phenylpropionate/trans-cinnamate dioxygenase ferredoxin reductase component
MTRVVIVGASLAGLRAAQTLRDEGFVGELTVVGAEHHLPYDRPPLSKAILLGEAEPSDIALIDDAQYEALGATWLLGRRATELEPGGVRVDNTLLAADGVVIATGARARVLPFSGLPGVHGLRTLDDALALRDHLKRADRVAVIGGGFIGSEVASAAARLGCRVTITMEQPSPLVDKVGPIVSGLLAQMMFESGVEQRTGVLVQTMTADDDDAVTVQLTDGASVTADAVVVGCGATPNVEWLSQSAVELGDGVAIDDWGRTSVPGVVAAGDVAGRRRGRGYVRSEHWTHARDMPVVAARTLLAHLHGTKLPDPYTSEAYFWSDLFGVRLQAAGTADPRREWKVVEGAVTDRSFVAAQYDGEQISAIVGFDAPRQFLHWRRRNAAALRSAAAVS